MAELSDNVRSDIFENVEEPSAQPDDGPEADGEGQVSQGGSGSLNEVTADGGADAVPDTPDGVPEDNIADADSGDYTRSGRDVEGDHESASTQQASSDVTPKRP